MNKKILKIIIITGVILISIIYMVVPNYNQDNYSNIYISSESTLNDITSVNTVDTNETVAKIKVHVTGEVNNPGIYELFEGDRIENAVIAAGGETANADLSKVNLAYELSDGQKIYIPSIFDEETAYIYNDAGDSVIVEDSNESSTSSKININKATSSELQTLNRYWRSTCRKNNCVSRN